MKTTCAGSSFGCFASFLLCALHQSGGAPVASTLYTTSGFVTSHTFAYGSVGFWGRFSAISSLILMNAILGRICLGKAALTGSDRVHSGGRRRGLRGG